MGTLLQRLRESMNKPGLAPMADAGSDFKEYLRRGGPETDPNAGIYVTEDMAQKLSVIYRCVRLISGTVSMLPAKVYRRLDGEAREEVRNHPVAGLFRGRANPWHTGPELRDQGTESLLQKGKAYWVKVKGRDGIAELLPLEKDRVTEQPHARGYRYKVTPDPQALVAPGGGTYENDQIFRLCAPGGKSVLENARESANLAAAQDVFSARVYGKGGNFSGTLETDQKIGPEDRVSLEDSFNRASAGLHRSAKVLLLPRGLKFTKMSMTANEAELIESRRFQVEDLARFYGVPPSMLGSTGALPRSNVTEAFREFLMLGLNPWLVLWETRINLELFGADSDMFLEFDVDGLLRGDLKNRFEAFRISLGGQPFMTVNEVRRKQNLNPVPGGNEIKEPVNMQGQSQRRPAEESNEE